MRRPLPPLNALKAFEATARHLSFSKAAEELHVTPAALSHQIRGLEDRLGLKLFHRRARGIELTEPARLIYPGIRTGFEAIREAVERLGRGRDERVLVVSCTPGLTATWLVPRLYRFLARHTGIEVRISASAAFADLATDGVDVGIRLSSGAHPELYVEKLSDEWLLPLCSPRLLDGERPLRSPRDLRHFPLIQVDLPGLVPTWADWMRMAGVEGVDTARGMRLNVADHALDAASEGLGVVLAYKMVAARDIALGRLVVPFGPEIAVPGRAYHLVCARGQERHAAIKAFRDWVVAEIADTHAGLRTALGDGQRDGGQTPRHVPDFSLGRTGRGV
jgi:LysR family glycine cleavage system transcriptional activator